MEAPENDDSCAALAGSGTFPDTTNYEYPPGLASLPADLACLDDPLRTNLNSLEERDNFSFGSSTTHLRDTTPLLSPPSETENLCNTLPLPAPAACREQYKNDASGVGDMSYITPKPMYLQHEGQHSNDDASTPWCNMSQSQLLEQVSSLDHMLKASTADLRCLSPDPVYNAQCETISSPSGAKEQPTSMTCAAIGTDANENSIVTPHGTSTYSSLIDMLCSRNSIVGDLELNNSTDQLQQQCKSNDSAEQNFQNLNGNLPNLSSFNVLPQVLPNPQTQFADAVHLDIASERTGNECQQETVQTTECSNIHQNSTQQQRRKPRTYSRPVPSQHCHICSRRPPKNSPHAACGNLSRGRCRKTICQKCFIAYGWDLQEAMNAATTGWVCPHCRNNCPERAQCHIYDKTSERRRNKTVNHRKPKYTQGDVEITRKRNHSSMENSHVDSAKKFKALENLIAENMIPLFDMQLPIEDPLPQKTSTGAGPSGTASALQCNTFSLQETDIASEDKIFEENPNFPTGDLLLCQTGDDDVLGSSTPKVEAEFRETVQSEIVDKTDNLRKDTEQISGVGGAENDDSSALHPSDGCEHSTGAVELGFSLMEDAKNTSSLLAEKRVMS